MNNLVAFVAGALFSVGLALSGMTQPHKIVAFLDFSGAWDPSLALVMVAAVTVHFAALRVSQSFARPSLAPAFLELPDERIDGSLVGGASLFGVGWGLGGFCPGPAVVSLAAAGRAAWVFVPAMLAGMYLFQIVGRRKAVALEEGVPEVRWRESSRSGA